MNNTVIWLLLTLLGICVFSTPVRAEEPLQYGYYVGSNHSCPQVPRISAFETKKLFDQGKVLLINPMEAHKSLLGAINIRADKLMPDAMTLPRNILVLFYCS